VAGDVRARIRGVRCWTCGSGVVAARRGQGIPTTCGQERDSSDARARDSGDALASDIWSRGARPEQGRASPGAGEGGGRSRGGRRRPPEQGRAPPEQDNLGNGKIRNIEVLFVKSTCHVSTDSGPPIVRNRVNPSQFNNQCTLEQICTKPMVFCNFAEY
jgi:hypothetical protein